MAATARPAFIPDIVEEHYDELQFLWGQRRRALRSPTYRVRELSLLEERIEARIEALVALGDHVLDFVATGLAGDADLPAFAAGIVLARLGTPDALARVIDAFANANGKKVDGLRDALANAGPPALFPNLASMLAASPPSIGAAAGEALAFQSGIVPDAHHVRRFLLADEPRARAAGWRLIAYGGSHVPPEWYDAAFADDDASAQGAALAAAAWTASPSFDARCRVLAASPTAASIDALATFAAIAPPEDYQLIGAISTNPAVGPSRFRVIGSFAHPYFIDLLIQEMSSSDPAAAVSAANAFSKMTGRDVESNTRVKFSPDGKPPADDFEAEFQDEAFLPDPDLARKHWQELAPAIARSPRICRGMDVSVPLARDQFATLDLESRWEYCLRMRLFSGWQGTPLVLERYPQRF